MASAWGFSWGLAFGKAWGLVTALVVGEPHTRRLRIPAQNRKLYILESSLILRILEEGRTYSISEAAARRIFVDTSSRIRSVIQASRKVYK